MVVRAEFTRTCDVCDRELGSQAWRVSPDPSVPLAHPNLRDNLYMVNGMYTHLCDECAKPLVIAIKLVGAGKKEQVDGR